MINFNYETDFILENEFVISNWISQIILSENKTEGEISYIFCNNEYLHQINKEFLNHDTLTDIISFDYSVGDELNGDIFISIEMVKDNALEYSVTFNEELLRVLSHGILHYCGYKDKTPSDALKMRSKEEEKINMFYTGNK
jgi:rRNA maturation RNase YbeY